MLLNMLKLLNWVDICVFLLLVRIVYISAKNGIIVELFKLLGITFTIYVTLHYYTALAGFLVGFLPLDKAKYEVFYFLIFIFLMVISYSIFVLLRGLICRLVKIEAVHMLSKCGGIVLGSIRSILTAGLAIYLCAISTMPYLSNSAKKSYSGKQLFGFSVSTYRFIWEGFVSKFIISGKFNDTVSKTQERFLE